MFYAHRAATGGVRSVWKMARRMHGMLRSIRADGSWTPVTSAAWHRKYASAGQTDACCRSQDLPNLAVDFAAGFRTSAAAAGVDPARTHSWLQQPSPS